MRTSRLKADSMGPLTFQTSASRLLRGPKLEANIQAHRAVIHGSFSGNVSAREKIEVCKTARVTCDLVTPGIVVEEGAF